jgi:hypothetical protein
VCHAQLIQPTGGPLPACLCASANVAGSGVNHLRTRVISRDCAKTGACAAPTSSEAIRSPRFAQPLRPQPPSNRKSIRWLSSCAAGPPRASLAPPGRRCVSLVVPRPSRPAHPGVCASVGKWTPPPPFISARRRVVLCAFISTHNTGQPQRHRARSSSHQAHMVPWKPHPSAPGHAVSAAQRWSAQRPSDAADRRGSGARLARSACWCSRTASGSRRHGCSKQRGSPLQGG